MTRRTYLRYPGGKSKHVPKFLEWIPQFDEYREPMVGGGSMFLYLKRTFPHKKFWINDLYPNLYLFWRVCRDDNASLVKKLVEMKRETSLRNCTVRFTEYKDKIQTNESDIDRAAQFYYLNKCSFSGLTESGSCSPQAWTQNFSQSSIESLSDLEEVLRGVKITNHDYQKLIEKDGENVFVYLDPPYDLGPTNNLYGPRGKMHKEFDHQRFYSDVRESQHKILISYNDSPILTRRFKGWQIKHIVFRYTMRQHPIDSGTGEPKLLSKLSSELLIRNWRDR